MISISRYFFQSFTLFSSPQRKHIEEAVHYRAYKLGGDTGMGFGNFGGNNFVQEWWGLRAVDNICQAEA